MHNSLWPNGLQHAMLPWPSLSPKVCLNSCQLSWQYCLIILSSATTSPFAFYLSQHEFFFFFLRVSSLHQVAKFWSFSFNISPFNEYIGVISFRIDWLDLLEDQGTLKRLLQHHSLKASVLQCPDFFMVQLSHPYMTTGKT